jgi:hypothetical protein
MLAVCAKRKELTVRILMALREAEGAPLTLDAIARSGIVGDKGLEGVAGLRRAVSRRWRCGRYRSGKL